MTVWAWRQHKHSDCITVSVEEPCATYGAGSRMYYYSHETTLVCRRVWKRLTGSGGTIKPVKVTLLGWRVK